MANYTVQSTGYVLVGAGLSQLQSNVNAALILVAAGIALEVLVGFLKKYNVPVDSVAVPGPNKKS